MHRGHVVVRESIFLIREDLKQADHLVHISHRGGNYRLHTQFAASVLIDAWIVFMGVAAQSGCRFYA